MKRLFNSLKYEYLEFFSFVLMIIWAISPIVEYILKFYVKSYYRYYFVISIYIVGILGIITYFFYLIMRLRDDKFYKKRFNSLMLIGMLLFISIISSICSDNPHLSFFGEVYRKEGLIVYIMYIGFILSSSIISNKKYIKKIFKIIIISSLFITIMPFFLVNYKNDFFPSVFRNFNHYGYYLMISTVLSGFMFASVSDKKRYIYLLCYVFLFSMLVFNNTFGCYLAMFIALVFSVIYSLIKKYKRVDVIVLFVIFIVNSILLNSFDIRLGGSVSSHSTKGVITNNILTFTGDINKVIKKEDEFSLNRIGTGRGRLWREAWNYTLDHPIIGGGMECLKDYYSWVGITTIDRPHNVILQFSSFIGIPGAIIYIIFIFYLAICNLNNLDKDIVNFMVYVTAVSYFISSLFGNSMYYTSPYFMILLGLLINMECNE